MNLVSLHAKYQHKCVLLKELFNSTLAGKNMQLCVVFTLVMVHPRLVNLFWINWNVFSFFPSQFMGGIRRTQHFYLNAKSNIVIKAPLLSCTHVHIMPHVQKEKSSHHVGREFALGYCFCLILLVNTSVSYLVSWPDNLVSSHFPLGHFAQFPSL